MLNKLTQIEDEMDECLMSVDADDVGDVISGLRRTCSENVRGRLSGGRLDSDDGCLSTVATSKSAQALLWRRGWKQTQSVGGATTTTDGGTSGVQLTDDDDTADGGVFVEVFPAAPVVITSDEDTAQRPTDDPGPADAAEAEGHGSSGSYVGGGLARSRSDVTSQRRFHRRRSAVRGLPALAPLSGLYVCPSYEPAPRHGHSCSPS